jgi:hypothetical protein
MGTTLLGHVLVEDRYYLFTGVAGEAHIDLLPHNAQSATLNIFSIRLLPLPEPPPGTSVAPAVIMRILKQ